MNNLDFTALFEAIRKPESFSKVELTDLVKRMCAALMEHDKRLIRLEKENQT